MLFDHSNVLPYDGEVSVYYNLLENSSLERIKECFDLKEHYITLFGKQTLVPRLVDYQGEVAYEYSGNYHAQKDYHPTIKELSNQVIEKCDFEFNSVLANFYREGRDSMGYHADDEPEIDCSVIASYSVGATRKMLFKHRKTKETVKIDIPSNTLLVMKNCQYDWLHAIPKTERKIGERLNLTFRKVVCTNKK